MLDLREDTAALLNRLPHVQKGVFLAVVHREDTGAEASKTGGPVGEEELEQLAAVVGEGASDTDKGHFFDIICGSFLNRKFEYKNLSAACGASYGCIDSSYEENRIRSGNVTSNEFRKTVVW